MTPSRADKFELSAEKGGLLIALFCHWETQVMKSWGILATIAMGFLMGLVLAGIGGISAGLQASSVQNKLQFKKIEDYWMATDIHKKDLQSVVNNANCYSSEKYFLSCVSSVVTAMQKTKLRLSYSGQVLLADSSHQDLDNFNERENLIPFTKIYKENLYLTFNFESIWKQIIEQSPESSAQYLYALVLMAFYQFIAIHIPIFYLRLILTKFLQPMNVHLTSSGFLLTALKEKHLFAKYLKIRMRIVPVSNQMTRWFRLTGKP